MSHSKGRVYEFGPFRFDAGQRLLFRENEIVPLVPKAADTLLALLEQQGRVVDKDDLMKLVWPDAVVEDIGLARNISLLRKALGAEAGLFIETIPKRGYRFAGDVRVIEPGDSETASLKQPTPPVRTIQHRWRLWGAIAALFLLCGLIYWQFYRPSKYLPRGEGFAALAVVPFDCLTPEIEQAGFSRGFNEVLVAELSKLNGVHIISPSTVRRYRQFRIPMVVMARLLGLQVIVEGTVQKAGEQLRISVRLVDVHSGKLVWAETNDYPEGNQGRIQIEAVRAIAAKIGASLVLPKRSRL